MDYTIYSKRIARLEGATSSYKYDDIPQQLGVQIVYIWNELMPRFSISDDFSSYGIYRHLVAHLREEYGLISLIGGRFPSNLSPQEEIQNFF